MSDPKKRAFRRTAATQRAEQPGASAPARWFWPALLGLCAVGGVQRALIVTEYLSENPLATAPRVDALTYWNWATRIAHGQLWEETPFFSAPLYPYLVGALRAAGGSFAAVYWVQSLLDLLTMLVLAVACRRRFNAGVGVVAGGVFLLLQEPASFSLRVLTCSLQLFLLAVTYYALVRVQSSPSIGRLITTGLTLGLLCLSYPPAVVLVAAVGPWLLWQTPRSRRDLWRSAIPVAFAALVVAPATIHNWRTSGDLFLIQAVSSLTLRQGNLPESTGIYTPVPNTTVDRERLFGSVRQDYARETGRRGTWRDIHAYHRDQVIKFWLSDPVRTAKLVARKVYYFLTGRQYGDVYLPALEIADGISGRLRLAPIATAWLIGPALAGLALMARRPIRYGPELAMFAVPFLVVAAVWFTPRYRLPAIPIIVVTAAWALCEAKAWRVRPQRTALVGGALAASLGLGAVNHLTGFDSLVSFQASYDYAIGSALVHRREYEPAAARFRAALAADPSFVAPQAALTDTLRNLGQVGDSIEEALELVAAHPNRAEAHNRLAVALSGAGREAEAKPYFVKAAELYRAELADQGDDPTVYASLARVARRLGQTDAALDAYRRSLMLDPSSADACYEAGVLYAERGEFGPAVEYCQRAVQLHPENADFQCALGGALANSGKVDEGLGHLERALALDPRHGQALNYLGITLARLGRTAEARDRFERAVAIEGAGAEACYNLGILATQEGREADSLAFFERALELDPAHIRAAELLASRYLAARRVPDAIRVLRLAVTRAPDSPPLLNTLAGVLATCPEPALRNGPEAVELAQRACELTGHANASLLRTLAAAYAETGDRQQAITTARLAVARAEETGQAALAGRVRAELDRYLARGGAVTEDSP